MMKSARSKRKLAAAAFASGKSGSALAQRLAENEEKIVGELNEAQGSSVDIGGYYRPDGDAATAAMCPSATLNEALESFQRQAVAR